MTSPAERLAGFLSRYAPEIAATARASVARMRRRLPGAVAIVYDNYNALVIGFSPTDRPSDALFSIAVYPKWVTLFFLKGVRLSDPKTLLRGEGKQVRSVRLGAASDLDAPGIRALLTQALAKADPPFPRGARGRLVIRSVSAKQRPRRAAS